MQLALINAVPFILALFLAVPTLNHLLNRHARAWLAAGVMATLFIALLGYFPQVQQIDTAYKQQRGIELSVHHAESDSHSSADDAHSETSTEASTDTDNGTASDDSPAADSISNPAIVHTIEWVPELGLALSFYLDGVSLLFSLIVTGIGAGIFLFAGYYFHDEDEQTRFLIPFSAFAGAMLGLVLSGNLLTLFIMWELTSITSYLLIGFKGKKSADARTGAMQALFITGAGALALITGIVLLGLIAGDITNGGGFVFDLAQILTLDAGAVSEHSLYAAAVVLLALGAFTKSAQIPFHFWLPGAMSAPTPASAYLHSATMVKAGIYLLLRLYPPLHESLLWTQLLVYVGVATMFIAALFALSQRDLKGLLAYSTISWLGALVAMIGLPDSLGIKAALVGIIGHALYKAALFLSAGIIDHDTGTRIIDKLGGLRNQMPVITGVVIVSALSMAGMPIFFGFVAKEVLLDAFLKAQFPGADIAYGFILAAAALTVVAGLILIWDVFFKAPEHEVHYHSSTVFLRVAPVLLAVCTFGFSLLIDPPFPVITEMLQMGVQKSFTLHLLPDSLTNPIFLTSLGVLVSGGVIFLLRGVWLPVLMKSPLPTAKSVYMQVIGDGDSSRTSVVEWLGDQSVKLQNGQIRYYLVVILGTVAMVILSTGIIGDLAAGQDVFEEDFVFTASLALNIVLLLLSVVASLATVLFRKHLHAALSLGVLAYSVGGLFLLEPAPDVSLVQFLIETLGTVLLIVMLGRISQNQRRDVMSKLWHGRSMMGNFNLGILRDMAVAGAVGLAVFFFSLTALVNRPDRNTIAEYHLQNSMPELGIEDVVGAIVADYRGMDTVIEVTVFAVAALGVLTLLTRGFGEMNPLVPGRNILSKHHDEFSDEALDQVDDVTNISTPFTRMVARILLPLTFMVGLSHVITGGRGPGDGFTAGAIIGLVAALWFVVYGYHEAKERLTGFVPHRVMRLGLVVVIINALIPLIFNLHGGYFLAHVDYGKAMGIADMLHSFGLEFTSDLIFEVGIALSVFGGIGIIMEAIAHPKETPDIDEGQEQPV